MNAVVTKVSPQNQSVDVCTLSSKMPNKVNISSISEPFVKASIFVPSEYIGSIMELCQEKRGIYKTTEYIDEKIDEKPLIVAPDKGAYPFAQEIAEILDCECTYLSKVRLGPDKVETRIVDVEGSSDETVNVDSVKGKKAFIIDDIIATGGTIVNAVKILKEYGAKSVDVCCVHPILVNGATMRIYAAGANSLISTNSLSADSSRVSLAKSIANVLRD